MEPIAHIETLYTAKFGVPRQAGLIATPAKVVFEKPYQVAEAVRCLEEFSHIWLIWLFHKNESQGWHPTVRPPRLGGNRRVGVFASRSPFRPNPIGLSAVRLIKVVAEEGKGMVLYVEGADMVDGTPILDIKPYLPYADCIPTASGGFASQRPEKVLQVTIAPEAASALPADMIAYLKDTLAHDPRPRYQHQSNRLYKMSLANFDISFRVDGDELMVVGVDVN